MSSTHLEHIRQAAAENGRQDLEPSSSEPEALAVLLQRIAALLNKFVELPSVEFGTLISLWIANTYTYLVVRLVRVSAIEKRNPPVWEVSVIGIDWSFSRSACSYS